MSKIKIKASTAKQPVVATEFRFRDSGERAVGNNGEINASSKRDLWNRVHQFIGAASAGEVMSESEGQRRAQITARNKELIQAAFTDEKSHRVLGEKMADSLYMTGNREGFARLLLTKDTLEQGSIPRFPVRAMNVTAVLCSGPTKVRAQITRDKWLTPPEGQLVAYPFVPQNELNQSKGDVLAEKYMEAQTALMVAEDRLLTSMSNQVVGLSNNLTVISGQLTPYTMMQVAQNVARWGLKTPYIVMASDFQPDIIGNEDFYSAMDPVARHELLLTGQIATAYGMTVISDAYRHPEHKVLNRGEFFVYADALNLGAYADRGGINSTPVDISHEKVPGRGWVLTESWTSVIANDRAVAKGMRV